MADLVVKIVQTNQGTAVADAIRDVSKLTETEKASLANIGQQADKTALSQKALRDSIQALRSEIPELNLVVSALKNPFVLLGAATATAIGAFRDFKREIDEMGQRAEAINRINIEFTGFREALAKSKIEASAFAQSLNEIAEKANSIDQATKRATDSLRQATEQVSKLRALNKELALQKVGEAEASGEIDPVEAAKRRNRIGREFNAAERTDARNAAIREITIKEKAERDELARGEAAQHALPAARAAELAAQAKREEEAAKVKATEIMSAPQIAAQEQRRQHQFDTMVELERSNSNAKEALMPGLQKRWDEANDRINQLRGEIDQQKSLLAVQDGKLAEATRRREKLERTVSESAENAKNLRAERQALAQATDTVSGQPASGAQVDAINALPGARQSYADALRAYRRGRFTRRDAAGQELSDEDIQVLQSNASFAAGRVNALIRRATLPTGPLSFDQRATQIESQIGQSQVNQVIAAEAKKLQEEMSKLIQTASKGTGVATDVMEKVLDTLNEMNKRISALIASKGQN